MVMQINAGIFLIMVAQVLAGPIAEIPPSQEMTHAQQENAIAFATAKTELDKIFCGCGDFSLAISEVGELRTGEKGEFVRAKVGNVTFEDIQDKLTRASEDAGKLQEDVRALLIEVATFSQQQKEHFLESPEKTLQRFTTIQKTHAMVMKEFSSAFKELADALYEKSFESEEFEDFLVTSLFSVYYLSAATSLRRGSEHKDQQISNNI